jgi:hypothetical protein
MYKEFQFEGQAETVSKYISANSVNTVKIVSVDYNSQFNRVTLNVATEKGQTGKADFSLSDNAFKYTLAYVASIATKTGLADRMYEEFPEGKCQGCTREEWCNKVANVITGSKVNMLFGGRQSNGKWYAQAYLFGGVESATEEGFKKLEEYRQSLQENERFMSAEKAAVVESDNNVTW